MITMARRMRRRLRVVGATVLFALVAGLVAASAGSATIVASNLANPRGIDIGPGKRLIVVESTTGAVDEIRNGNVQTLATISGAVDVASQGEGNLYAVVGGVGPDAPPPPPGAMPGTLVKIDKHGGATVVADIGAYAATHPDPDDLDQPPNPTESNPNGLALLPGHRVLVSDAAANRLLLVDKNGGITTIARVRPEEVRRGRFRSRGQAPTVPAEAVPTAVAVGPDGAYYVSELTGFPFTKGAARIWRIAPGTVNAVCDPQNIEAERSVPERRDRVLVRDRPHLRQRRDDVRARDREERTRRRARARHGVPPDRRAVGREERLTDAHLRHAGGARRRRRRQDHIFVTTSTFGPPGGTVHMMLAAEDTTSTWAGRPRFRRPAAAPGKLVARGRAASATTRLPC